MRAIRPVLAACFAAAAAVFARDALAQGAIVGASPAAAQVTAARVAVASTGTRTSRWVSLSVHASPDAAAAGFAWILPATPGAFVDLASDAWLESLEDATMPRVVPPSALQPAACPVAGGVEVEGDPSHLATTLPDAVTVALDAPSVASALAPWGLAMPGDLAPLVDAAGATGVGFVVLHYPVGGPADVVTRTVRVVDASAPAVDLSMTGSIAPVAVTAYALTTGPASFGAGEPLAMDPSLLLWNTGGGSNYAAVRDALLASSPGAWLVETTGHSPLFTGESLPPAEVNAPIEALAPAYFERAATYGDTADSGGTCTEAAESVSASLVPVAPACPAGALARVGPASCVETVGAGEIGPDAFRCGGTADDLALALSGLGPGSTWVSRARSLLAGGGFGGAATVAASGAATPATGPVVACSGYGPCAGPVAAAGMSGGDQGNGGSSARSTGGSSADPGAGAAAATDVAASALDDSGGCGGDSSSSSEDESSGDSCGGSGGGDSSSSGDTCSGSDSSSGDCAVSRSSGRPVRFGRSPVSRVVLLLVAIAAIARRRGTAAPPRGQEPPRAAPRS